MWKEWIDNNLFNKNGKVNSVKLTKGWLLKSHPSIYSNIIESTGFFSYNASILLRIYSLYYNIDYVPKCKYCKSSTKFISFTKGFANYCSKECANKSKNVENKRKQTKFKNFGNYNYNNRISAEKTCLEKYGTTCPAKSDVIKEKIKNTNLNKYGVEWYTSTEDFRIKFQKYSINNYNVNNLNQKHIKNINNLYKDYIETYFIDNNGYINISDIQDYYNISISLVYKKLKELNVNFKTSKSQFENQIFDFLKKYTNNIKEQNRIIIHPLELDFYLPDYKIAIEFNGNYYHSYEYLNDKYYHIRKTKKCDDKNINLIHIFQYQWERKQSIIKSIILSKMGIFNERIYARKCEINEIDNKTKNEFLENNHLQGKDKSSIKLGLYYNDVLVSVITFGKRKISKHKSKLEMIRFCNKLNTQVIGAASKLFKYYINNYWDGNEIISYANRQHSNGNIYKILGFKFVHDTPPNYFYYKGNLVLSRMKCQKHKLNKLLDNFDTNLSEYQNMIKNNYHRVYDSGNKLYKYK